MGSLMSRGFKGESGEIRVMSLMHVLTGGTMNFRNGPDHKYFKDSAQIPATCYNNSLLLSDSISNQLQLTTISFLQTTPIKILCK